MKTGVKDTSDKHYRQKYYQIQILKSDEVLNEILKDKKTLAEIKNLYKRIPEKFLLRIFDLFLYFIVVLFTTRDIKLYIFKFILSV